jgi:Ca2+/H+ antiporter
LAPKHHLLIIAPAALAIPPLATWMRRATEHLVERMDKGVGSLFNATFGNAAELIIAIAASRGACTTWSRRRAPAANFPRNKVDASMKELLAWK